MVWEGLLTLGLGDLANPHNLEPSAAVGDFSASKPEDTIAWSTRIAVELDTLTARILKRDPV